MFFVKNLLFLFAVVTLCCEGADDVLTFPFEHTVIVTAKGDPVADFAAKELNAIVKKVTSRTFQTSQVSQASHRIFVGTKPEGWMEKLKSEELVVTTRGNDLYLFGERFGTLWAVYEFCERELGYSWPFLRMDGEIFEPRDTVSYSGKTYRSAPAFPGYRCPGGIWHYDPKDPIRCWWVRNRDNRAVSDLLPDVAFKDKHCIPGHGFLFYIPPEDPDPTRGYRPPEIKGRFKDHPEWFSLGQDGRRHPDMQLCLSNKDCRKALLDAVLAWVRSPCGGKGIYMVGSNDNHNTRYCWCADCIALEKKYDSVGGPLWDWLIEACAYLKSRPEYEGVRLTSLAYKGPDQTERAPKGIEKFPDNFVCDAAFLNSDRTLHEVFPVTLPDGTVFRRYENLLKWRELCDHVSYWYYGGSNPAQVYDRMAREVRELQEAGVESVYGCGTGGGIEFGDMTGYLFQRLLWDPAFDAKAATWKLIRIKYGPAAEKVMEYIDVLGGMQREAIRKLPMVTGCDSLYDGFGFLEGTDLVRLRKIMDAALACAKGSAYEPVVLQARIGLNIWTMTYFHKIRAVDPVFAATVDCKALDVESRAIVESPGFLKGAQKAYVLNNLNEMANYANLKDDSLPTELAQYPADKVFRILPPKRASFICGNLVPGKYTSDPDPLAVSGWAYSDILPAEKDISKGIGVDVYDGAHRKWLMKPTENPIPLSVFKKDGYALFKLGTFPIPSRICFVFAGLWGSPTSISQMQRLYDPTYENRQWEMWVSVRGEGPKFFADAAPGESRLFIDQVFCVDKGVPADK